VIIYKNEESTEGRQVHD